MEHFGPADHIGNANALLVPACVEANAIVLYNTGDGAVGSLQRNKEFSGLRVL
jgi:hypothetical protein